MFSIEYIGGAILIREASTGKVIRKIAPYVMIGYDFVLLNHDRTLAVGGAGIMKFIDVETGHVRTIFVPLNDDRYMLIAPDGHWKGSPGIEDEMVYVALTEDGEQLTLSSDEFAVRYGWKNDPERVQLKLDE